MLSRYLANGVQVVLGVCLVALATSTSQAQILISDNFSGVANGATLNGTTPTVDNIAGSPTWTANFSSVAAFTGTGGNALNVTNSPATVGQSAFINLGTANYLSVNPGTYMLSLTITMPTGDAAGSSWVGFGFLPPTPITDGAFTTNNGSPWLLNRFSGLVNVYGGPSTSNAVVTGVNSTLGVAHTFVMTLNTTLAKWTLNVTDNGTSIVTNYVYATNPTTDQYVGLTTSNNSGSEVASLSNFQFSVAAVPEPGSWVIMLGGLGSLVLFRRVRRLA